MSTDFGAVDIGAGKISNWTSLCKQNKGWYLVLKHMIN